MDNVVAVLYICPLLIKKCTYSVMVMPFRSHKGVIPVSCVGAALCCAVLTPFHEYTSYVCLTLPLHVIAPKKASLFGACFVLVTSKKDALRAPFS